ncbi:hypothetical protein BHE74_00012308 [Ensete ventricosum]|nr:hypothetical protein BHE74_00012308 [Ensete ventricosum]
MPAMAERRVHQEMASLAVGEEKHAQHDEEWRREALAILVSVAAAEAKRRRARTRRKTCRSLAEIYAVTEPIQGKPLRPPFPSLLPQASAHCLRSVMWSLEQPDNSHKNQSGTNRNSNSGNNRVLSSSSSSSRSSPSSNTSILIPETPGRRTMEEVWKDITLNTFHQERPITPLDHHIYHHHHHANSSPSFKGMILQDFLAGPLNRPLPVSQTVVEQPPLPLPLPLPPYPSPALPETALSLNSGLEFQYLGADATNSHSNSSSSGHNASFISSAFSSVAVGPPSPTDLFSLCSKKRLQENTAIGVDRHHKRMIKNRESAARSRARKQAWNLIYPLDGPNGSAKAIDLFV